MTRHHFVAFILAIFLGISSGASATVTPIPGATPQEAPPNVRFPNPIGVQVTDAGGQPVPGATVRWSILVNYTYLGTLIMDGSPTCMYDLGLNCTTTTDASGIAYLPSMYGRDAQTYRVPVSAYLNDLFLGSTDIFLTTLSPVPVASVTVASGSGQRAVIGTPYAAPFVVRVTRDDGIPVPGASVTFRVTSTSGSARGTFDNPVAPSLPDIATAMTDSEGYARAPKFTAGWGMGPGTIGASWYDSQAARMTAAASFDFFNTNASGGTSLDFQGMWWAGLEENGWGLAVAQHGDRLFSMLFTYDEAGNPDWRVMSDGRWTEGVGSTFLSGALTAHGAPFFAYDASKHGFDLGGSLGLSFQGPEVATLQGNVHTFTNDGRVLKKLERFDFSTDNGEPMRGVADMWWGGASQNGWGVSIMEMPGGLFSMWFTYDENGKATWFVMPEGRWTSANTFEGRMYKTRGSRWLGTSTIYDPSKFQAIDVGPYKLRFLGPNSAELDYNVEGRAGTLSLSRLPFGDVD